MATTLSRSNRGKPTPPFWRGVGRALVVTMGIASTTIALVPIPSLLIKGLIIFGINALLYLGKELTTLTFNPAQVPLSYFPQPETPLQPATKDVSKEVEKIEEVKEAAEEKLIEKVSK